MSMLKRFTGVMTAVMLLIVCITTTPMSVIGDDTKFGGYNWAPCQEYDTGTNWVNNAPEKLVADFSIVPGGQSAKAGIWTGSGGLAEDWSNYKSISMTVTNKSTADIIMSFAVQDSAWLWHESPDNNIPAGGSKDIVIDVAGAAWQQDGAGAYTNKIAGLFSVSRATLMIKPTGTGAQSGQVEFTNWKLTKSESGGEDTLNPVKGFQVDGNKLLDANGNPFVMRGLNFPYCWFTGTAAAEIPKIANYGANAVRLVLSNGNRADGQNWGKVNAASLRNVLNLCADNKIVAVVEVQDTTDAAHDDPKYLLDAAKYFIEMKSELIGKEDKVIINIANEWPSAWGQTSKWTSTYKEAIALMREAGLTHTIMIDAGGYGQDAATIHNGGKEVFNSDPLKNTMFSIHMYGTAGKNAATIKTNIDKVLEQDLALVIGEFGFDHSDGDVDEAYLMSYCKEKSVGWLAWSWFGNGGNVQYLDMVGGGNTPNNTLTDWGETVINGPNGWKETSEICSVFTGAQSNKLTVHFDANGGINAPADIVCYSEYLEFIFTIPEQIPTWDGFTFVAWSYFYFGDYWCQPGEEVELNETEHSLLFTPGESEFTITLDAIWKPNNIVNASKLTVNFDANGGENPPPDVVSYCDFEFYEAFFRFIIPSQIPIRDGYTFLGWSYNSDSTEPDHLVGEEVAYGVNFSMPGGIHTLYETLNAVWQPNIDVVMGDLSGDGEVATNDLIILAKFLTGRITTLTDTQKAAARLISGSDAIDADCLLALIKFMTGEVTSLPI